MCEGVAEILFVASIRGDTGHRGAEATAATATPHLKPAWQFGDVVDAVWDARLGTRGARPDELVARHGREELEPALGRPGGGPHQAAHSDVLGPCRSGVARSAGIRTRAGVLARPLQLTFGAGSI